MKHRSMPRGDEAGVSLVEMAIVLIVISLVIGAVLKGQDLISNSRGKRFSSFIRGGEIAQWVFLERFGRFAGDGDSDGQIEFAFSPGGDTENPITTLQANLRNFNGSITLGGATYYLRYGYRHGTNDPVLCVFNTPDNVLGAASAFNEEGLAYARAFDAAIDGHADPSSGKVVGLTGSIMVRQGVASLLGITNAMIQTSTTWDQDTVGLLYYFDTGGE